MAAQDDRPRAPARDEAAVPAAPPAPEPGDAYPVPSRPPSQPTSTRPTLGLGLALTLPVAAVAYGLGRLVPVVGGPVFAIVLGMIVRLVGRPGVRFRPGVAFASKTVLQAAIVMLGTGLGLGEIVHTGLSSLPVMLGTMTACLLVAWVVGRAMGVTAQLRTLVGVGTGICGASAIAAASSVIGAAESDIAYSISTIFVFNAVAVLLYPTLGHLMQLGQHAFGLWAGTAINDTSSVVAASYTFGQAAGNYAVIVKLTRTTLIIPITLFLAVERIRSMRRETRQQQDGGGSAAPRIRWRRIIPWFIVWFIVAAVLHTVGAFPHAVSGLLGQAALVCIVVALAGVGLSADFHQMRRTGAAPLLLGAVLWATVGLTSLGMQHLTGQL